MVEQHAQAARALGEESGELPWAVVVSRRAHHLPTDNFGIGSNLQRESKVLIQMRSRTGMPVVSFSIAGNACRFNRYDQRCITKSNATC